MLCQGLESTHSGTDSHPTCWGRARKENMTLSMPSYSGGKLVLNFTNEGESKTKNIVIFWSKIEKSEYFEDRSSRMNLNLRPSYFFT